MYYCVSDGSFNYQTSKMGFGCAIFNNSSGAVQVYGTKFNPGAFLPDVGSRDGFLVELMALCFAMAKTEKLDRVRFIVDNVGVFKAIKGMQCDIEDRTLMSGRVNKLIDTLQDTFEAKARWSIHSHRFDPFVNMSISPLLLALAHNASGEMAGTSKRVGTGKYKGPYSYPLRLGEIRKLRNSPVDQLMAAAE